MSRAAPPRFTEREGRLLLAAVLRMWKAGGRRDDEVRALLVRLLDLYATKQEKDAIL